MAAFPSSHSVSHRSEGFHFFAASSFLSVERTRVGVQPPGFFLLGLLPVLMGLRRYSASAAHSAVYLWCATSENRSGPFLLVLRTRFLINTDTTHPSSSLRTYLHGSRPLGQLSLRPLLFSELLVPLMSPH